MVATSLAGELVGDSPDPFTVVAMRPTAVDRLGGIAMDFIPFVSIVLYVHDRCVGLFKIVGEILFVPIGREKFFT